MKHILLMWFVLFALSPCIVKGAIFGTTINEYTQPLNKSKAAASTNFCQYSLSNSQQDSITKRTNDSIEIEPVDFHQKEFDVLRSSGISINYSKTYSGNSPPKYILYQRLKLGVS